MRQTLKRSLHRTDIDWWMHCGVACHTGLDELPVLKAPDLRRLRGQTDETDIIRRLAQPESIGNWSSMPVFGFSESEAKDVAAFLMKTSTAVETRTTETPAWKEGDIEAGQKLLLTTGCWRVMQCHTCQTGLNRSLLRSMVPTCPGSPHAGTQYG